MTPGYLIKTTANKKLLVKIDEKTWNILNKNLAVFHSKTATFTMTNDEGELGHFVLLTLDKYDKANMTKWEKMCKQDIIFNAVPKTYDFTSDDGQQISGCNYVVTNLRPAKSGRHNLEKPIKQHACKEMTEIEIAMAIVDQE
jgi:hypothetical protein